MLSWDEFNAQETPVAKPQPATARRRNLRRYLTKRHLKLKHREREVLRMMESSNSDETTPPPPVPLQKQ